jgi:DNA helicase HerA-like ATPase
VKVKVGEVVAVMGVSITVKMLEVSNKDTLYFEGEKYKGVSIREHLIIQRGFVDIVCVVEGEYLDEKTFEHDGFKKSFVRKVEVKPIGYFRSHSFFEGVKYLPMIKDSVFIVSTKHISAIYHQDGEQDFKIGRMLKENLEVFLPWKRLFNTHIGIFGNTGSGKSNTLTKLYTELFNNKHAAMRGKSEFILLDFNGEYTGNQLLPREDKNVFQLNTQNECDKFPLRENEFWNVETLSILFQATTNTQRPFLRRLVESRRKFQSTQSSLADYSKSIFKDVFSAAAPKPECLDLLRSIANILNNQSLTDKIKNISWHKVAGKFTPGNNKFYEADGALYRSELEPIISTINVVVDPFKELMLRANIRLCKDLLLGHVQFEHIQPLLKRIDSCLTSLQKVISIGCNEASPKILTIISLRRCDPETKKVLPLLIAKHFYNHHKDIVKNPPENTMHLIIDEAHNILSEQSKRESEIWKDYRLELFEEIIKEGRKYGMFLTISSQRPADISPTIISQIHNFFIHRLVNERDLFLIDNTITTLDKLSREMIPNLPRGACIATGTSFNLPMVIVADLLEKNLQPDSEDVDLEKLWQ